MVEMPPHGHRVGFFAVDPEEIWTLRASVAQHFGPLSRTLGHRVKLRRGEDLTAATAVAPAAAVDRPPASHPRSPT